MDSKVKHVIKNYHNYYGSLRVSDREWSAPSERSRGKAVDFEECLPRHLQPSAISPALPFCSEPSHHQTKLTKLPPVMEKNNDKEDQL
ncbi:hypothetical protein chiPu_0004974 [Chiloscyllium punctatum]|uniref:Uncharacterized protein n=1 Tax=Chiloscyllium punctatum TaxID=137246 RepID=A0A401S834_CHIPU|nr:hypothetical protein [Chiloscyllium punctatum]